ncbi:hypothetical protein QTG94_14465 [Clostridium perfringens]|nr:hypothetical protein [Clostridium perfringens]
MGIESLYTDLDIRNIGTVSISNIRKLLKEKVLAKNFTKEYIITNLDKLLEEDSIKEEISNIIFAGKGSIKWYRIEYSKDYKSENLKNDIEDKECYDRNLRIDNENLVKNSIISIVEENNIFTMKILIVDGYRKTSDGISCKEEEILKVIIVKMDVVNGWVEIRGSDKQCKKVKDIIEREFSSKINLNGIMVLNKYQNNVEVFKGDLDGGFYLNSISMPAQEIKLTQKDADEIKKIFESIDNYRQNGEIDDLKNALDEVDFPEGVSISEMMLAGLDSVNIKIRNDSTEDISTQAFYSIFKEYTVENASYIIFTDKKINANYTIQIGVHTNNIRFVTNATEKVIKYIRDKIV